MILTRAELIAAVGDGRIVFDPFDPAQVNPNSMNYRLGSTLKAFGGTAEDGSSRFETLEIGPEGIVLEARRLYLGHTMEVIGSPEYAMSLIGRSSLGRLGLFLQISANLGHRSACHQWTLELFSAHTIRLRAGDKIGQVTFWETYGPPLPYDGYFGDFDLPAEGNSRRLRQRRSSSANCRR